MNRGQEGSHDLYISHQGIQAFSVFGVSLVEMPVHRIIITLFKANDDTER